MPRFTLSLSLSLSLSSRTLSQFSQTDRQTDKLIAHNLVTSACLSSLSSFLLFSCPPFSMFSISSILSLLPKAKPNDKAKQSATLDEAKVAHRRMKIVCVPTERESTQLIERQKEI